MKPSPSVISVILNTNRRDDTLACLASLQRSTYREHRALVLDNASTDGSVDAIRATFPQVEVVQLTANLGYAGNNNAGIQLAMEEHPEWILLLNEDTVLAPECLARLVEVGASNQHIGIAGPLVYHFDSPDVIQSAGGKLDRYWQVSHIAQNEFDDGRFTQPRDVDWISGCCIMIRRQVVEQIGPLDERYFYYWEETELCIRARKRGWRIVNVPKARLWHKGVQVDYKPGPSVTYYATRNRLLTLSKHRAPLLVRLVALLQIVRTLASWTTRPKWRHMRAHRHALWRGLLDFVQRRWGPMPGAQ